MALMQVLAAGAYFAPQQVSYSSNGTYTPTIPSGATTALVECWGASGGGAAGHGTGCSAGFGVGGSSGGYSRSSFSVASGNGKTLSVIVGNGGAPNTAGTASSVASGTFSITTLSDGGGAASGGAGGSASGGNVVNTTGNVGVTDTGGAGIVGIHGTGGGGGNGGFGTGSTGGSGVDGLVIINYT